MNKLKRISLIVGVSVLSLALVACGGGNNGGNNAAANNEANNAVVEEEANENANANNNEATEEAEGGDVDAEALSELGEIAVVSREDGSGTRGAFVEIVGLLEEVDGEEEDLTTEEATVQNSTNGVMTTVAGNPSSIGYISLGSLNETVKALDIDGVEATPENIIDGKYAISRPFLLVTKGEPAEGSVEEDFLKYAHSAQGQAIIEEEGYVKVEGTEDYEPAEVSGNITVAGSTSVTPVMEKLAEEYQNLNPDVTIEIQSTGSSAGITSTIEGTAQIGMSSRDLKEEEKSELEELVLAQDGIAVVVNNENPLENISLDNVKAVFGGDLLDWEELAD